MLYNILLVLFYLSLAVLLHSYLFYPFLMTLLASKKKQDFTTNPNYTPEIAVLIAAYNEEKVIKQKIKSILSSDYPEEKLKIYIGSDASTDRTDQIVSAIAKQENRLIFKRFEERTGKAGIVNQLALLAKNDGAGILIMTDANVMFVRNTIRELVSGFSDPATGQIAANILSTGKHHDGIAFQEEQYIQRENLIKYHEGKAWGTMMGAFGACYAVRTKLMPEIPKNFMMEDFFISMHVLKQGYKAISNPKALAEEDVSFKVREEFIRKKRISAGNYQNLMYYKSMLWPVWKKLPFSFWSHKVLRWFGPFFLIILFVSGALLAGYNTFYFILFMAQLGVWLIPLLELLLQWLNIQFVISRFVYYFYAMNLALLAGFFKYLKGIKTNVWQPIERNR